MIQAFVPGEIEPGDIHRLGKRFLSGFFENEYQMIIGTHVDTEKPHNHMLVNSVNRITGRMLDFSINARKTMERYSDALYEEMGLTKVPYTRHVDYSHEMFWQIIHDMKCEIDLALSQNRSYEEMLEQLKGKGYELTDYPMEHYHVARIRGYQTRVHLKYLGYDYSKKRLMERTNARTILAVAPSMRHEIVRQSPGMRTRKDYIKKIRNPLAGEIAMMLYREGALPLYSFDPRFKEPDNPSRNYKAYYSLMKIALREGITRSPEYLSVLKADRRRLDGMKIIYPLYRNSPKRKKAISGSMARIIDEMKLLKRSDLLIDRMREHEIERRINLRE